MIRHLLHQIGSRVSRISGRGVVLALCASSLALTLVSGAIPPFRSGDNSSTSLKAPEPKGDNQGKGKTTDMTEALRLITDAADVYAGVTDYSCTLTKCERIKGQMQPENTLTMKVRKEPFSIHLKWNAPKSSAGQEVCYVAGKNNGQLRVKPSGLIGLAGFVSLSPTDPNVCANSRHIITEAGVGNLIDRTSRGWNLERTLGKTHLLYGDYEFNHRPVRRVETIHDDSCNGQLHYHRTVLYFDKATRLPTRIENYDWPRQGGPQEGDLLEVFNFVDIQLNVGLPDETFNK